MKKTKNQNKPDTTFKFVISPHQQTEREYNKDLNVFFEKLINHKGNFLYVSPSWLTYYPMDMNQERQV